MGIEKRKTAVLKQLCLVCPKLNAKWIQVRDKVRDKFWNKVRENPYEDRKKCTMGVAEFALLEHEFMGKPQFYKKLWDHSEAYD